MLFRKNYKDIDNWYKGNLNALLVTGARQVGKSTLIKEYLESNNIDYVSFDLIENSRARQAFDTSINAEQLLLRLTAIANKEIVENKTIIFIDEAQAAKDAITPIKYLVEDGKYRYIFSGSLLGVKIKDIVSVPVGYMHILNMYPMDFEEFCIANKVNQKIINYLKDCFTNKQIVDEIVNKQMLDLFNLYLIIGGMPQAVNIYLQTNNIQKVNDVLLDIDKLYLEDISRYDKQDKLLIEDIYNLIPSELNAQNKRFILKNLNEKARYNKYNDSFVWLKNSGVGLYTYNVDNPKYPLLASKERSLFKLFLCDVGLLNYKLFGNNTIDILNGNINVNYGSVYENVVAQELTAHGYQLYYNNNKKRGEIDFLIENGTSIIPIEVKSGKDYIRHCSLNNLLDNNEFNINESIILTNDNVVVVNKRNYYPIYMIMFVQTNVDDSDKIKSIDISSLQ